VGRENRLTLRYLYRGPHNHVAESRLVLEAHEDHAGSGFGTLSVGDDAGDAYAAAAGKVAQVRSPYNAESSQLGTQECEGMSLEG
jgi:hypothetical protein